MDDPFTPEEVDFLKTAANERGWYLYSENARPIIDGLCERGLMAANGAFKMIEQADPAVTRIAGIEVPHAGKLVSYYCLIRFGNTAFRSLHLAA